MNSHSIEKEIKESNVQILKELTDLTTAISGLSVKDNDPFMYQLIQNKLTEIEKQFKQEKNNLNSIIEMSSKFDNSLPIPDFGEEAKFNLEHAFLICGRLNEHRKLVSFYRKFYGFITKHKLSEKASINLLLDLTVGPLYDIIYQKKDESFKDMIQLLIEYTGEVSFLEKDISELYNFTRSPSDSITQTMCKISELIRRTEIIVPEKDREYRTQRLLKEYLLRFCSPRARKEILSHERDCIRAGVIPAFSVLLEIGKNYDVVKEKPISMESYPVQMREKHPNYFYVNSNNGYDYYYDSFRRKFIKLKKLNFPYVRQWIDYNPSVDPIHQSFSLARYDHFEDELF